MANQDIMQKIVQALMGGTPQMPRDPQSQQIQPPWAIGMSRDKPVGGHQYNSLRDYSIPTDSFDDEPPIPPLARRGRSEQDGVGPGYIQIGNDMGGASGMGGTPQMPRGPQHGGSVIDAVEKRMMSEGRTDEGSDGWYVDRSYNIIDALDPSVFYQMPLTAATEALGMSEDITPGMEQAYRRMPPQARQQFWDNIIANPAAPRGWGFESLQGR